MPTLPNGFDPARSGPLVSPGVPESGSTASSPFAVPARHRNRRAHRPAHEIARVLERAPASPCAAPRLSMSIRESCRCSCGKAIRRRSDAATLEANHRRGASVLLPMARAIAEGNVPAGSLVRLVAKHDRVDLEVEPPEPATDATPPRAARAGGHVEERAPPNSCSRRSSWRSRATPLAAASRTCSPNRRRAGFWDDPASTHHAARSWTKSIGSTASC